MKHAWYARAYSIGARIALHFGGLVDGQRVVEQSRENALQRCRVFRLLHHHANKRELIVLRRMVELDLVVVREEHRFEGNG
jgi:hypothetical protein